MSARPSFVRMVAAISNKLCVDAVTDSKKIGFVNTCFFVLYIVGVNILIISSQNDL